MSDQDPDLKSCAAKGHRLIAEIWPSLNGHETRVVLGALCQLIVMATVEQKYDDEDAAFATLEEAHRNMTFYLTKNWCRLSNIAKEAAEERGHRKWTH